MSSSIVASSGFLSPSQGDTEKDKLSIRSPCFWNVPVDTVLLHLEWIVNMKELFQIANVLKVFLQKAVLCRLAASDSSHMQYLCLARHLVSIVGEGRMSFVLQAIMTGRQFGLYLSPTSMRSVQCVECPCRQRYHLFCPNCGTYFDKRREYSKIPPLKHDAQREKLVMRALRNMKSLFAQDDEFVSTQGGDLLFLLRNIAFACLGKPQQYALTLLKQSCDRWIAHDEDILQLMDDNEIGAVSLLESVHAMIHLVRAYQVYTATLERDASDSNSNSNSGHETTPMDDTTIIGKKRKGSPSSSVEGKSSGGGAARKTTQVSKQKDHDAAVDVSSPAATTDRPYSPFEYIGSQVTKAEAEKYRKFVSELLPQLSAFLVIQDIRDLLECNPITGRVPMTPGNYCNECGNSHTKREKKASRNIERRYKTAPQSPTTSQSSSKRPAGGAPSSPSASMSAATMTSQSECRCLDCGEVLQSCIDYFALSSALCNSYLYLDCMSVVGASDGGSKPPTLSSPNAAAVVREEPAAHIITTETLFNVLAMFPVVRRYKGPHKLQRIAFLNQCYFVTHLVYTFSDWGQHSLHRNLFQPEYDFIVAHMDYAIEDLNNPEIVGEFLQCLKILQYHPSRDRDLIDLEERGLKYLLHLGEATSGKWSNDSQSFYDQYHSIYCATIGLLPYYYSEDAHYDPLQHTPNLLHYLVPTS